MSEFQDLLQEQVKDSEIKKEWDDIQAEMDVIRAMIDARIEQNLTQTEFVPIQQTSRKQQALLRQIGRTKHK